MMIALNPVWGPRAGIIFRKSSAPGSKAAWDKWLGREKATNRRNQGRGPPFGGSGGQSPRKAGGCGGAQPPASRHPNLSQNLHSNSRSTALAAAMLYSDPPFGRPTPGWGPTELPINHPQLRTLIGRWLSASVGVGVSAPCHVTSWRSRQVAVGVVDGW